MQRLASLKLLLLILTFAVFKVYPGQTTEVKSNGISLASFDTIEIIVGSFAFLRSRFIDTLGNVGGPLFAEWRISGVLATDSIDVRTGTNLSISTSTDMQAGVSVIEIFTDSTFGLPAYRHIVVLVKDGLKISNPHAKARTSQIARDHSTDLVGRTHKVKKYSNIQNLWRRLF